MLEVRCTVENDIVLKTSCSKRLDPKRLDPNVLRCKLTLEVRGGTVKGGVVLLDPDLDLRF